MSRKVFYRLIFSLCAEPKFISNAPKFVEILQWKKDGKEYLAALNQQEEPPVVPMVDITIDVPGENRTAKRLATKEMRLLMEQMSKHAYDYVFALGQKPCIKDKIYVETRARAGEVSIDTEFDCEWLAAAFCQEGIEAKISHNAGTSFCNKLYFNSLQYIGQLGSSTRMVFLHVPFEKNITDIAEFSNALCKTIKRCKIKAKERG